MYMSNKKHLLCTFSNVVDFKNVIDQINCFYKVHNRCVFVFYNTKNEDEFFITYSIVTDIEMPRFPNTISVHRKKQTNTLYTLNAMNRIIQDENGGVFDKTFIINWEYYKNSLIITDEVCVKIIPIKIYDIINC